MTLVRIFVLGLLTAFSWSMGQTPAHQLNAFGAIVASSFFILAPALYFIPTYEAWMRKHPSLTAITALNVLLGWTLLGWVAALVWALKNISSIPPSAPSVSEEVERLAKLRESGALTNEEFESQKQKVLSR